MKIHFCYQSQSEGRGVGFYAQNLLEALRNLPDIDLVDSQADLDHYPYFDLFYPTLPLRKNRPTLVTIHDLTPLVLEDLYPKGLKGSLNLLHQKLALRNIKGIITDSDNSKEDIVRLFGIDPKIVFDIPLAVDPLFRSKPSKADMQNVQTKYHLPDQFVLCVAGGPNPNKNLPLLAQASQQLKIPLVLVGKGILQETHQPVHPELKDLVTLQSYKHIIKPGFVPTVDLVAMYKLATIYCQPSLYEGFGLPVLEAMTAGCLVVAANTSSLPEIVSKTTPMFDPYNLDSLIDTLSRTIKLSAASKEKLINHNSAKANNYSWEITAQKTAQVYRHVLTDL